MVAELLARLPSILIATVNPSPVQAMAMEGERLKQEVAILTQRLMLSEQHGIRLASSMDAMKNDM